MSKRKKPLTPLEQELRGTFEKLQLATKDLGPNAGELLKAAALQLVRTKLEEIGTILGLVGVSFAAPTASGTTLPTGSRVFDFNQLDAMDREAALNIKPAGTALAPCQLCGNDSVYKTKRGVTLCASHQARGIQDDKDDAAISSIQSQAFGKPDVIHVDPNQFPGATNGDGG